MIHFRPRHALHMLAILSAFLAGQASTLPTAQAILAVETAPALVSGSEDFCGYDPAVDALLGQVKFADWSDWVHGLSGDMDVQAGGQSRRITTRYSPRLFDGGSPAYGYVREQIGAWYPVDQIEEDPFSAPVTGQTWKNLVLTIPGAQSPDEIVILSAHLDSTSSTPQAPGADDNATGSAALLEAARVLRGTSLPRTLRIIWFTGEEFGMLGSAAYTQDHALTGVVGVINLDMIGYDGDGDRCFEVHAGILPQSQTVGQCLLNALETYAIDLHAEYLTTQATDRSDHSSFWRHRVGALELSENLVYNGDGGACSPQDINPNYHNPSDTFANMHPAYGFDVARAGLAAAFSLASEGPLSKQFFPVILSLGP